MFTERTTDTMLKQTRQVTKTGSHMALVACFIVSLLLLSSSALFRGQETAAPHLSHRGVQTDFIVDGQPFIMLGGQAQNSSASNLEDIETVYQALDAVHANTAEIPLSWNLIEPEQGKFDFHLLDGAVTGARRHGLKLVFLWFGTTRMERFHTYPIGSSATRRHTFVRETCRVTRCRPCRPSAARRLRQTSKPSPKSCSTFMRSISKNTLSS